MIISLEYYGIILLERQIAPRLYCMVYILLDESEEFAMLMDKKEIETILPHRDPMLLITTVEELIPGERILATFYVNPEREIFKGHFPSDAMLPGVYTVECIAQAADVLLLSTERYRGKIPLFLGINNVKFLNKIRPNDTIEICASLTSERKEKSIATCHGDVFCKGQIVASGDVTLAMR